MMWPTGCDTRLSIKVLTSNASCRGFQRIYSQLCVRFCYFLYLFCLNVIYLKKFLVTEVKYENR